MLRLLLLIYGVCLFIFIRLRNFFFSSWELIIVNINFINFVEYFFLCLRIKICLFYFLKKLDVFLLNGKKYYFYKIKWFIFYMNFFKWFICKYCFWIFWKFFGLDLFVILIVIKIKRLDFRWCGGCYFVLGWIYFWRM